MNYDQNQDQDQQVHDIHITKKKSSCCSGGGAFWGSFLIIMGGYFFAKEMGWISHNFPFWPLLIVGAGLWMIISNKRK